MQVKCCFCGKKFDKTLTEIKRTKRNFCSKSCRGKSDNTQLLLNCKHCGNNFLRMKKEYLKRKNHFCSLSCSATYYNSNKTFGYSRSKLELWLEKELKSLYPNLEIHYARKDTINAELDIYIPSLKFAVELNGPTHYKPIFGKDKLLRTQNNDNKKSQICLEKEIELLIVDVSQISYFKPERVRYILDLIVNAINIKLNKR